MKNKPVYIALLLAFLPLLTYGQKVESVSKRKITISGYVTDINHNPVAEAIILIDKNKTDVVTNRKGYYKVKTEAGAGLITVFISENNTIEEPIDGRTEINFTMSGLTSQPASGNGDSRAESDANAGNGPANRKNGGSSANKINNGGGSPVYSDIYQMMAGKVPGVEVRGKSIKIRGTTSILLSGEPLFVVDNIIVSTIDNISPIDVKTIEVLKGASAGIYGSRGSNGVIVITLKSASDKR